MKKEEASRLEKLENLKNEGINPYPSVALNCGSIANVREKKEGEVIIAGKIISLRSHGKSTFADLEDESAKIQLYFKLDNLGEKKYQDLSLLDAGDYIQVKGDLFSTHAGELTVEIKEFSILAKSLLPIPDKWYGLKDTEIRYRKRFLDLIINDNARNNLRIRSKIVSSLRSFMEKNNFIEIETPVLQPIPGGAAAKPFKTKYNILGQDMYLRIAPELYLKRLIVGGFERVYEIGKNFRNEGLSHMHNPEFTMMEFYWAYQNYESLMDFTEKLVSNLVKEIKGKLKITYQGEEIDFKPPYKRVKFIDLIRDHCGIDLEKSSDFESLKKEVLSKNIDLNFKEISTWPKLADELYKKVARPKIMQPTFLIDYPSVLKPLAKAKAENSN
ncbi:MAG: lysine--tRNA ligase, partial [Patescibacteria group bacterium]|nr:lysine--tRNA ligase [Patescibacteria group bacterium]